MVLIPENLVLENERALLRRLELPDIPYLQPFALNEPELWRYSLLNASGPEGMKAYINQAIKDYETGSSFPFIIYDKKSAVYAGSTRYYDIQPAQKTLQIGYTWYGKTFQGTGLNKNCKYLLLEYAFDTLGFERVEFRADASNHRSIAAMQSIGCMVEGILRSHLVKPNAGRRDSIILSILKNEWTATVRDRLSLQIKNLL